MNWFGLTLLSQFSLIVFYFVSKRALSQPNTDARFYGASLQLATGLISLPLALIGGFKFDLNWQSAGLLVLMVLIYIIAPSLYYTGLQKVDLSETTILDSSGSVWTLLLGVILLGEELSWQKLTGVGLVLCGVSLLTLRKSRQWKLGKYELILLLAALAYAIGAVIDNALLNFTSPLSYLPLTFLMAGSSMMAINLPRLRKGGLLENINRDYLILVGVGGFFTSLTYLLIFAAYSLGGEVSAMYPIQQLESMIVPLLAVVLLGERERIGTKLIAGVLAVSGVMLLG